MSKRASPTMIGAFVIGAVVLSVVAVGVFGSGQFFRNVHPYVLYFRGDVNGLKVGAPVKFKGIQIGSVRSIMLRLGDAEEALSEFRVPVLIELDEKNIVEKGGRAGGDPKSVARLIEVGLRAQLKMESFVTGILYIDLDIHPGTPLDLHEQDSAPYPEIPTLPTALEEAQVKAAKFLAKLNQLNLDEIVGALDKTVSGLERLVNSPRLAETIDALPDAVKKIDLAVSQLQDTFASIQLLSDEFRGDMKPLTEQIQVTAERASETMEAARQTLRSVEAFVDPESPVVYRLGQALTDLAQASAAIRRFAEALERNPGMLVRGKATTEGEQ
jgi:paraquat-inducible protein B